MVDSQKGKKSRKSIDILNIMLYNKNYVKHRGVEQLAARWAHNPKVVSSSLTPATRKDLGMVKNHPQICYDAVD